nr:RdgB/HAM1 family non-canonical purine NTP pyrophosphatase [Legionella jordanis]
MSEIILATSNPGKIKELQEILSPLQCIPQNTLGIETAIETGFSFIENAILKARHASRVAKKAALADDSGLVVEALQGEPGIYSARYAGDNATDEENISLLLNRLRYVEEEKREAYFYCAIAVLRHEQDPTPLIATGKMKGRIVLKPQGEQGFGYDPIFFLDSYQCTVAQLTAKIKNEISHRAQALQQLRSQLLEMPLS